MLPRLFIGSARESLEVARSLQEQLFRDAKVSVWDEVLTRPASSTLQALIDAARDSDFGVFIFSPDDFTESRSVERPSPRDNVVLEYGLFLGILGAERTYIVSPVDIDVKLPTDLYGITISQYRPTSDPTFERSALGPAASAIRKEIARLGRRSVGKPARLSGNAHESIPEVGTAPCPIEDHKYIVDTIAGVASSLCADLAGKRRLRRSAPFRNYGDKCVYARLFLAGAGDVALDFYLQRLVNGRSEILVQLVLRPEAGLEEKERVSKVWRYEATIRDALESMAGFVRAEKQRADGLPRWVVPERSEISRDERSMTLTAQYISQIARGLLAVTPFQAPRYGKAEMG